MAESPDHLWAKAEESLVGAETAFLNSRYNNCANRCYYACFQAAVVVLTHYGIQPPGRRLQWGHDFVQAQFAVVLVNRRKLYPATLRDVLTLNNELRETADYRGEPVTQRRASAALRRTRTFLAALREGG